MRILLSNDDGIYAEGIRAMFRELKKIAQVWVVAPLEEKSTTGHSLTIHKPLRMIQIDKNQYGVSGSPADCVYMGIREVMNNVMPDIVVSGINRGANLGQDVYYSGTVSAAREAAILGIPALAVSLSINFARPLPEDELNYAAAAKIAVKVIRQMAKLNLPEHTLLNLNVPDRPLKSIKGVALARQGFRFYSGSILRRKDHRGRDYYWVGGAYEGYRKERNTDCDMVERGYACLTPLKLDSTDLGFLGALQENWILDPRGKPTRKTKDTGSQTARKKKAEAKSTRTKSKSTKTARTKSANARASGRKNVRSGATRKMTSKAKTKKVRRAGASRRR